MNNHWPHALRPSSLIAYGTGLLLIKLAVTALFFITFPTPGYFSKEQVEKIFNLTNEARKAASLHELSFDPYLSKVAETRASDMAEKKYFSHYTPEGYAPWYFIDTSIYDYKYAGENLAMNFTEMESVQNGFMASPGHKNNILNPRFYDVGFAIKPFEINGKKTQVLVSIFGGTKKQVSTLARSQMSVAQDENQILPSSPETAVTVAGTELRDIPPSYDFPKELIVFPTLNDKETLAVKIYRYSHLLFLGFIVFFVISLFLNIIIKIHIQHGELLFKSALLVGFVLMLVVTKIHFLEDVSLLISIY